jgi:threonine aldolase
VVSVTQSTELGTVYRPEDLRDLADHAHGLGMALHMDGARLSNAAASLGVGLAALTTDVGVDVLSLGGTKNGLMLGEAVVVLDPSRAEGLDFLRKSSMQLASKMRYVSAQLVALFEGDLWLRNASHANAMAARLGTALSALDGVELAQPVEANGVFVRLPRPVIEAVQETYRFYVWQPAEDPVRDAADVVRLMCSWDTTEEDVDTFAHAVVTAMASPT